MRRGDRVFPYGRLDAVEAVNDMLPDVDADRPSRATACSSGPATSARRPYSEAFLYYLLPELDPATRYIEMDPGVANADDSGMADELRRADIVILSSIRDDWDEPNDSRTFGPNEPNEVIEDEFCLVESYGRGAVRPRALRALPALLIEPPPDEPCPPGPKQESDDGRE